MESTLEDPIVARKSQIEKIRSLTILSQTENICICKERDADGSGTMVGKDDEQKWDSCHFQPEYINE